MSGLIYFGLSCEQIYIPAYAIGRNQTSINATKALCDVTDQFGILKVTKHPKMRRDSVSPFRDKLWDLFQDEAKGMDGANVVVALRQAGEEIWSVGIDGAYSSMKHQDDEALGNAFDITWLTIVCIKLREIKAGKRPRLRTTKR